MTFFFWGLCGTLFLLLMTSVGAAAVFLLRRPLPRRWEGLVLGFAAGVMSAAGIWSLLLPALQQAGAAGSAVPWLPAAAGLAAGTALLARLDVLVARRGGTAALLPAAITLHNIPEGLAVGLGFAMVENAAGLAGAWALALGIGIQNIPEGTAISLPLRQQGMSRGRAFARGVLSGVVEPLAGMSVCLAAGLLRSAMPWLLSFAAGAMLYVVVEELIPQGKETHGCLGFTVGFLLMMVLDTALG